MEIDLTLKKSIITIMIKDNFELLDKGELDG